MHVLQCYIVIMPYFVSMIWLAMSALGCWPNASGWSTLGSILMYSCKKKSLQLLERLFMSIVGCYHSIIGFAFADHWLTAPFFLFKNLAHLAETNHSKPAALSTNQRQHCLTHVSPLLALIACFSALGNGWTKGYWFCSFSFFSSALDSTHGKWVPRLNRAETRYVDGRLVHGIFSRTLSLVDLVSAFCQS